VCHQSLAAALESDRSGGTSGPIFRTYCCLIPRFASCARLAFIASCSPLEKVPRRDSATGATQDSIAGKHLEQSGAVEASRDAGQRFAGVQDDGLLAG